MTAASSVPLGGTPEPSTSTNNESSGFSHTSLRKIGNKLVHRLSVIKQLDAKEGDGGLAPALASRIGPKSILDGSHKTPTSMLGEIMTSYATSTLPPGMRYSIVQASANYDELIAKAGIDVDAEDINIEDLRMHRLDEDSDLILDDDSDDDVGYRMEQDTSSTNIKLAQKERSVLQMVDMLSDRLTSLNAIVINRYEACKSDLDEATEFRSSLTKKMTSTGTGAEEDGSAALRYDKSKRPTPCIFSQPTNPVDGDNDHIVDPARLTFRHAPTTDAGRKLEFRFEHECGISEASNLTPKFNKSGTGKLKRLGLNKIDARKQERMYFERKLQSNLERYVTRAVSDVIYRIPEEEDIADDSVSGEEAKLSLASEMSRENFPIPMQANEMNPKLLLSYTCERIVLPGGSRMFRHFTMTLDSQQLFVYLFWFIHCKFFQESSLGEQAHLLHLASTQYVKVLSTEGMDDYKDLFFKHYPFLVANAIFWGFYYLCPGSRHLYSSTFKRVLYLQCARILSGVEVTPVSITEMQAKIFPDEAGEATDELDYHPAAVHNSFPKSQFVGVSDGGGVGKSIGTDSPHSRSASGVGGGGGREGLRGRLEADGGPEGTKVFEGAAGGADVMQEREGAKKSKSGGGLERIGDKGTVIQRMSHTFRPNPLLQYTGDRSTLRFKPQKRDRMTTLLPMQQRTVFDAAQISPMLQEYLGQSSSTAGRRSENIIRTIPVAWCQNGGVDTYHRHPSRKDTHDAINEEHARSKREYARSKMRSSEELRRATRRVELERKCIFKQGLRQIGVKSMDIVTDLNEQGALKWVKRPEMTW